MADYILSIGPHDPEAIGADSDSAAVRQAAEIIETRHAETLRGQPEAVVSLIGPNGMLTPAGQRSDDFVRLAAGSAAFGTDDVQLGETPDCNAG